MENFFYLHCLKCLTKKDQSTIMEVIISEDALFINCVHCKRTVQVIFRGDFDKLLDSTFIRANKKKRKECEN